jgi:hypothetical protein
MIVIKVTKGRTDDRVANCKRLEIRTNLSSSSHEVTSLA